MLVAAQEDGRPFRRSGSTATVDLGVGESGNDTHTMEEDPVGVKGRTDSGWGRAGLVLERLSERPCFSLYYMWVHTREHVCVCVCV